MSRTFKMGVIYFISAAWLIIVRLLFNFLSLSDNISNWLFSIIVQIIGLGLIPMLLYRFWGKEKISCLIRSKTKVSGKVILFAIIIGFLARHLTVVVSGFWQIFIQKLGFTSINSSGTIFSSPEVLYIELFCTAVLPAVFEEITHRGLLQDALADIRSDKMKIIIMAIFFGLMHQNVNQVLYTMFGGLIMAYLAVHTNSLIPSMIVHFINNAFSVLYSYSYQKNGLLNYYINAFNNFLQSNVLLLLVSWVVAAVFLYALLKQVKILSAKNKTIYTKEKCRCNKETIYEYRNNGDYSDLDMVFGISTPTNNTKTKAKWYEYAFLYGTAIMTVATTLFTFIWGVLR